jgi:hypothetical protein
MALKIYSDLLNTLKQYTESTATDYSEFGGTIDTIITMAENRIFREIRCREMEQTLTSTVTISSGVVPLPAGYIDLKYAYLSNEQPRRFLKKRTASWIYERYPYRAASGRPLAIAREGTNFIFGPYADASSTYTIGGYYWGRPDSIIGVTTTASANAVFLAHPDLYVAAAVSEGRPYLKGIDAEGVAIWESKYQNIKRALLAEVQTEDIEGSEIIGDE